MITGHQLLLPLLFFINETSVLPPSVCPAADAPAVKRTWLPKDSTQLHPVLELKAPASVVSEKSEGYEATVIVKTRTGHGSGFAITNDGYIITAYQAIDPDAEHGNSGVTIITSEGEEIGAVVLRGSAYSGLALIKTEKQFPKAFTCPLVKQFKPLQSVYSVGASISLDLGQSVSPGMISNERIIEGAPRLQLNMSVNYGMSGAPVFDDKGMLHGVVVSKLTGENTEGVSFAVPAYLIEGYLNI